MSTHAHVFSLQPVVRKEALFAPRQVDHHTVWELYRTADRHGTDELAFGFGEDLVHLACRQNQRVTGPITYFTIGHGCPPASLEEQDHFLRVVAVRRSRRIGVHAAEPHLDLLRAARGCGHAGDVIALHAVDLILLLAKHGPGKFRVVNRIHGWLLQLFSGVADCRASAGSPSTTERTMVSGY